MGDEGATWVGQRAVAWVVDEAPVPADLAFTLIVIARRCDDSGRGSYQSLKTIAEKTGKSEAQTARDIRRLRELGLLVLGDQGLPGRHGVHPGMWPTVYDVPLSLSGPKPAKQSKNPTGVAKDAAPAMAPNPRRRRRPIRPRVQRAVFERDGYACVWCSSTANLSMDHVIPWSLGGPDTVENLRVLCRDCNSRRGARV